MMEITARVILQEKGLYRVSCEQGEFSAQVSGKFRYTADMISDYPAVGDYVAINIIDNETCIITELLERNSCFVRKSAGKVNHEQVVAANVDIVFICMSLNKNYNMRRLERYLAICWDSKATPVVVLTKKDLCDNPEDFINEVKQSAAGVDVVSVSSELNDFKEVSKYIEAGKTYAFLGSSGVGKSTLINCLLGRQEQRTSETDDADKGRHTTTHRELLTLESGAFLLDTPGMRELGLWDNASGIDTVFSDIEEIASKCRFSDCRHSGEPGCAIKKAIMDGVITEERWNSYKKLKKENSFTEGQSSHLKAKNEKFKQISKINKSNRKK